uniref:Astacin domain-containing protein n=1 Tax=Parastrongyloides trichosuri TaxID=131310 RepID=A0A0N4ZJ50_PARTI
MFLLTIKLILFIKVLYGTKLNSSTEIQPEDKYKNVTINYYYEDNVNVTQLQMAIKRIENETCLTFNKSNVSVKRTEGINIFEDIECSLIYNLTENSYSQVELINQFPCLKSTGYYERLIVEKLGIINKKTRNSRRNYFLDLKNVINASLTEQYYRGNFSSLQNFSDILGEKFKLDFDDFKLINQKYCNKCSNKTLKCSNGGYQNPMNCSTCLCPYGFTGTNCKRLFIPSRSACNNVSIFTAQLSDQAIAMSGKKHCEYKIRSNRSRLIQFRSTYINMSESPYPSFTKICPQHISLEIKTKKDKSEKGICICGNNYRMNFTSECFEVVVIYNGLNTNNSFGLFFKELLNETETTITPITKEISSISSTPTVAVTRNNF